MNPGLISIVLIGAVIFYAVAVMSTYESFALYGALTLFLVGISLIPMLASVPEVKMLTETHKNASNRR